MIYPDVTVEEWCARYSGLEPDSNACIKCGIIQVANIPVAFGKWRGLQAPIHDCGPQYQLGVYLDIDPASSAEWAKVFNLVKKECE